MRKVSIVVFACFTICFQVSAQCEQHMVQFHCYNSLGASLFIRDAADVVLIDTTIAAYTVANNFILELDLEAGCYTIQLTNDVNFTTYFYGVDSNGTAQYTWFSAGNAPEFSFSVGGTGGCGDPAAVNYIPGACAIPDNNTLCNYAPNAHFLTMELCEALNGDNDEVIFSIFRACDGASFGYSSLNIDGGHTVHQYVLYDGDYLIDFSDYGVPVVFSYVLQLDGVEVASGSSLDDIEITVGTGSVYGCADSNAINFDPAVECNDGSCEYSNTCPVGNPCSFEVAFLDPANPNEYACFAFYDMMYNVVVEGCVYEAFGDSTYTFCIETGCYMNFQVSGFNSYNWWLYDGNGALAASGNDGYYGYFFCIDAGTSEPEECNDPAACNYDANATNNTGCHYSAVNLISILDADADIESMNYTITNTVTMEVEFTGTLTEGQGIILCHDSSQYELEVIPLLGFMNWQIEPVTAGTLSGNSANGGTFYTTDGTHLPGCTHPLALNYQPWATQDNGSCIFPLPGCMDPAFCNYNPAANVDDGNCMNGQHVIGMTVWDAGADGMEGAHFYIEDESGNVIVQGTYDGIASSWNDQDTLYFCLDPGCYTISVGGGADDEEIHLGLFGINNDANTTFGIYAPYIDFDFFVGEIPQGDGLFIEAWETGPAELMNTNFTLFYNGAFLAFATYQFTDYAYWYLCAPPEGCYMLAVDGGDTAGDVVWKVWGADQDLINITASDTIEFSIGGTFGCTDPEAVNFDVNALCDDQSCVYDPTGDLNDDGTVNSGDLLLFLPFYGCTFNCGLADFDGNGAVNTNDLLLFLAFFGNG